MDKREGKRTGSGKTHVRERTRNALRILGWTTFGILLLTCVFIWLYNYGLIQQWFNIYMT